MPQKRIARYRRNLKYALFPSLLLCFLYIVWGPMEVYMGNAAAFRFEYLDILLPLLGLAAACSLAIMLVISFFPRKLFRLAVAGLFALSLCSYIQNLFLNLNLGLLEGEEIILNRLYEQREGELVPTGNELIHTWKQEVYGHETTPHPRTVRPRKLDADGELPLGEPDPDDPYFFS